MFKGAHLAHSTSDGKIWSINTPNSSGAFSFGSMLKLIGSNWLAQGSDIRFFSIPILYLSIVAVKGLVYCH